jgi:hypothetical protein
MQHGLVLIEQCMPQNCIDSTMSEVIIKKVATAMRCNCGHLWLTTSKSKYPSCPRCHIAISRKKHAVILESDTTRRQKEIADSGSQVQNAARST